MTTEERWCARRKFVRHLYFMQHIEVYWVPSIRGIITRTVNSARAFRLPAGSQSLGVYAYPVEHDRRPGEELPMADEFLARLDLLLAAKEAASA